MITNELTLTGGTIEGVAILLERLGSDIARLPEGLALDAAVDAYAHVCRAVEAVANSLIPPTITTEVRS